MSVHGYGPPIDIPPTYDHDIYFTWRAGSWGQATWQTAWESFEQNHALLDRIETDPDFRKKVTRAGRDLIPMLRQEINGEIDSVGVWWSLALVCQEGVSINPVTPKVKNIGVDGSGIHSGTSTHYQVDIEPGVESHEFSFPPSVEVNETLNKRYNSFMTQGLRGRFRRWIKEKLRTTLYR
jgi:hypothetical protein